MKKSRNNRIENRSDRIGR